MWSADANKDIGFKFSLRDELTNEVGGVLSPMKIVKVKISTRSPPNLIPGIIINHFA